MAPKVGIVGGGIAGLAAAFYMQRSHADVSVTLLESSKKLGGAVGTIVRDGFLVENSGDMFVTDPNDAVTLCKDLGIEDQLIETNREDRFSSILRQKNLIQIPSGFSLMMPNQLRSVLRSPLLDVTGKLRFMCDYFVRPNSMEADESLSSFAIRHYGRQAFERIIQPLVAGIYSAKAEELSVHATMQRFVQMEREYGSLIKAARVNRKNSQREESSGARYGMFVAPKNGMQSLVDAVSTKIDNVDVRLATPVERVTFDGKAWRVNDSMSFDSMIFTANARVAAKTIDLDPSLLNLLRSISFGSLIVIAITCSLKSFPKGKPKGFGFVVPEIENRELIACSYASNKFAGRALKGSMVLRCFVGGRNVERWRESSDNELIEMVHRELGELIGYSHTKSDQFDVFRWMDCMPQYRVGHLELVKAIKESVHNYPGLSLAGCSYDGVGIPACIASGKRAAKDTANFLADR